MRLPAFDFTNALQERVGADGLAETDFVSGAGAAAVEAFRARVTSNEIGFPNLPNDRGAARAITEFADDLRPKIDDVLVLGIGGSALGACALDAALRGPHPLQVAARGRKQAKPRLLTLDNVDPGWVSGALAQLNPRRTALCVIAKSGNTAETLSTFMIAWEWLRRALGKNARTRVIAITDPEKGDLRALARDERLPLFFVPPNVGGRFSVFCPVGLVPAALAGLDINRILAGAWAANTTCWKTKPEQNPALAAALVHHALATRKGKTIEVVFAYSQYLWSAAFWYRQLWAESLGKRVDRNGHVVETGQTPVAALGVTDQHSQLQLYTEGPPDKMITFWAVQKPRAEITIPRVFTQYDSCGYLAGKKLGSLFDAERRATESALTHAGRPNCRWTLPQVDEATIGAFFQMLEFQTAFAGELWGVNAFDQPGVELGKKMTYGLMGRKGFEEFKKV